MKYHMIWRYQLEILIPTLNLRETLVACSLVLNFLVQSIGGEQKDNILLRSSLYPEGTNHSLPHRICQLKMAMDKCSRLIVQGVSSIVELLTRTRGEVQNHFQINPQECWLRMLTWFKIPVHVCLVGVLLEIVHGSKPKQAGNLTSIIIILSYILSKIHFLELAIWNHYRNKVQYCSISMPCYVVVSFSI